MLDKLEAIKARYDEIGIALSNPEIVSDNKKYKQLSKEYRDLEKIVIARNAYEKILGDIEFNKEVLNSDDEEMRDMAKEELPALQELKEKKRLKLGICFLQKIHKMNATRFLKFAPVRVATKRLYLPET